MKSVVLYFAIAYNTCERYHKGVVQDAKFKKQKFLTLLDFSQKEVEFLLNLSEDLKRAKYAGIEQQNLKVKHRINFEKDSTRTLCV